MWAASTLSERPIVVNKSVEPLLKSWESDPLTFLRYSPQIPQWDYDLPAQLYCALGGLDQSRAVDSIRWRLYLLAFYQLKQSILESVACSIVEDVFVSTIANFVRESPDAIKKKTNTWTHAGARYWKIADDLGRGSLLLLPDDIGRTM